ncbi:MAG TPA: ABC transporter ATP-binding protein/permease [Alphaproteobacteria bacterium]|nr:ABC transporter ATP-binding protein/permease [Alphaproteobacteria bacterium]
MAGRHLPPPEIRPRSAGQDIRVLRLLLPFVWPRGDVALKLRIGLSLSLLAATALVNALVPILFARAVDRLSGSAEAVVAAPVALLIGYGLTQWLGKAMTELRWIAYGPIEQRVQRRLSLRLLEHLHGLSLRFHLGRRTGALSRNIERGLMAARDVVSHMILFVLPLAAELVVICAVLLGRYQGVYAVITVATLALYSIVLVVGSERLRPLMRQANLENSEANGRAIDSLLNYETVKYFGSERQIAVRYDEQLQEVERLSVRGLLWRSLTGLFQVSVLALGLTLLILLAGRQVAAGQLSVGDLVLLNTYLLQLIRPLDSLGRTYRLIKNAITSLEQTLELLEEEPEVADRPGAKPLPAGTGALRFDDVRFAYDPRRPVLHGLNFAVEAGRTLGIVGASGAGKSTIVRLLFRCYDPTGGVIRLDGADLRDVQIESLRAAIAVVPQDAVLFNETITFNIAFGRPEASQQEIEAAARLAHIHDFIAGLPDGYATMVGERGLKLSGGEKQRVAIARAVLKRPRLYLFDEATSALDSHTERAIQENLREVSRGTTTVIITHRLSSVVHADEILVLDRGRVVERGAHDALLSKGGRYAALWMRQQQAPDAAD